MGAGRGLGAPFGSATVRVRQSLLPKPESQTHGPQRTGCWMWSMGSGMGREESLTAVELGPRPLSRCAAVGCVAARAHVLRVLSTGAPAPAPTAPGSSAAVGSARGDNEAVAAVAVFRARTVFSSEAQGPAQRAVPRATTRWGEIAGGIAIALSACSAQKTRVDQLQRAQRGFDCNCDV